jgi:hypothetical protein
MAQGVGSRNEQFIRYTPSNTNANMNSGAAQRIIRCLTARAHFVTAARFMFVSSRVFVRGFPL